MEKETALKILRELHDKALFSERTALETFIPELKESEDERIRGAIIDHLKDNNLTKWATWLEKQGEHKLDAIQWKGNNLKEIIDFTGVYKEGFEKWFHNSWEEYEKYVHEHNNIFKIFNEDGSHIEVPVGAWIVRTPDRYNIASRYIFRQKPTAWSEEDEEILQGIWDEILANKHNAKEYEWKTYDKFLDWLKSLKDRIQPQNTWKPSEEQMNALDSTLQYSQVSHNSFEHLNSLYNELEKLKG